MSTMESIQPAPRPAEPTLASSLLDEKELDSIINESYSKKPGPRIADGRIGTGIRSVDEALGGSLRAEGVVCVSGELGVGVGGIDLCLSFLTTSLLASHLSMAALIDTTGNVDVLRIYNYILSRLRTNANLEQIQRSAHQREDIDVEELAAKVLDRVKIMRVFDLVGVMEAIGEIRADLEEEMSKPTVKEKSEKNEGVGKATKEQATKERKTVIADSEDEDDDEMLFDAPETTDPDAKPSSPVLLPAPLQAPEPKPPETGESIPSDSKVSFILIDNLAHVLSPLLKKDYNQANALASALLRSLYNLTHTHSLLTLLLNPASVPQFPSTRPLLENQLRQPQPQPIPPPSVFASNKVVPALGNLLSPYLDMHLLVSTMPKRKVDARALAAYEDAREAGGIGFKTKSMQMVSVVEVLADRWEGRVGGWGTFTNDANGLLKDV